MGMDEGMNNMWKWIAAFFLCLTVLTSIQLYDKGKIAVNVSKMVYGSEDLSIVRGFLRETFKTNQNEDKIVVSSESVNQELLNYVQVMPFQDGYLLTYEQAVPIISIDDGLVVYTGYSKDLGKTITVHYEHNTTVTYGQVDTFSLLPYTSIEKGSTIGHKEPGELYIQVEKDGKILNLEETLVWMREHMQP